MRSQQRNQTFTLIGFVNNAGGYALKSPSGYKSTTAAGTSSFLINKGAGMLFTYSENAGASYSFLGFEGKEAGYMTVFCICAVAYLIAWMFMKILVPVYKKIEV